jgi:hypothetical protein
MVRLKRAADLAVCGRSFTAVEIRKYRPLHEGGTCAKLELNTMSSYSVKVDPCPAKASRIPTP